MQPLINARRVMLSCLLEGFLWGMAGLLWPLSWRRKRALPAHPQQAEDLDPTQAASIENPYHYYRVLRDQHPLYRPPGQDFYCVSRYHDIQTVARDTRRYSSNIVNVLMSKSLGRQSAPAPGTGSQRNWGVVPVDVLAIQDPPAHKYQKLLTHQIMSHDFVAALEPDVSSLAAQLVDQALQRGEIEFMDEIAWYLPMCMALRLVGFPEADYPQVKRGCAAAIRLLSGTLSASQYMAASARALALYRYCWSRYRRLKQAGGEHLGALLARAAQDPEHPLSDDEAVSIILQMLIAGSDSSASTMGNAVRLLAQDPALQQRLREQPARLADFIEEVLRLESAFQGHFRVVTREVEMYGRCLPPGTRVFLLWASGNRDERVWDQAEVLDIDRDKRTRHLTFGHGLHACLGRELARMEIRIVLETLLQRSGALHISGPTPHVASLFTRTLQRLPLRLSRRSENARSWAEPDAPWAHSGRVGRTAAR